MPYGIDKNLGGDSKENTQWMENCVNKVTGTNKRTGKPYTKSEKIAICKSQMKKSKETKAELIINEQIEDEVISILEKYKRYLIDNKQANTEYEAVSLMEMHLARVNYDIDKLTYQPRLF